jgi:hypothetical protein
VGTNHPNLGGTRENFLNEELKMLILTNAQVLRSWQQNKAMPNSSLAVFDPQENKFSLVYYNYGTIICKLSNNF